MTTRFFARRSSSSAILAALLLLAGPSSAAPPPEQNSIHAGATSIQFLAFGGSSRPLGTSGIFVKTHFSDRGALRMGVALFLDESSGTAPYGQLPYSENLRNYSITVSAEIDEYVDSRGPVTAYLGIGPYWTRVRSSGERYSSFLAPDSTVQVDYYKTDRSGWEVGASLVGGFEWFFKRKLSVIGRVGASLGFGKRHETYHSEIEFFSYLQSRRVEYTTATAGTSTAALGFGVYF